MPVVGEAVGRRQGQEDAETPDDLLEPPTPAAEPTFPEDAVPGVARTGRIGGQFGPYANAGQSSLAFYTDDDCDLNPHSRS